MKYLLLLCILPIFCLGQTQIGIDIDGNTAGDLSGYNISLSSDGSIIAIGSHKNSGFGFLAGHVRVFRNNSGTWTQIGNDIEGEVTQDQSGWSVSLSLDGNVVTVGAIGNSQNGNNSGHVKIYENVADTWEQVGANINGDNSFDRSGFSVSLSNDGSIVAIGANRNNGMGASAGHVKIYENILNTWTQVGEDIDGEAADDLSGGSVSISSNGSMVSVGALGNDSNAGHVKVYENIGNVWTQVGEDIDGASANDKSGTSESLSAAGNIVAIGSPNNNSNGIDSGHVRVFENIEDAWVQVGADIFGDNPADVSGANISLSSDGNIVAVGATGNDGGGDDAGHVKVYQNISGNWTQIGVDIEGEAALDLSGHGVSLSADGTVVAIGARGNDGNGNNAGHVRVYDLTDVLSSDSFVKSNFRVYPNPSTNIINIQLNEGLLLEKINMYTALGQLVKTMNNNVIPVSELAKGSYFLEVVTNKGKATKVILVK